MDNRKYAHEQIERACDNTLASMLDDNVPKVTRICIDAFRRCFAHWAFDALIDHASVSNQGEALVNALSIVVFNFCQLHARDTIEAQNAAAGEILMEMGRSIGHNLIHTYGVPNDEGLHQSSPTEGNA